MARKEAQDGQISAAEALVSSRYTGAGERQRLEGNRITLGWGTGPCVHPAWGLGEGNKLLEMWKQTSSPANGRPSAHENPAGQPHAIRKALLVVVTENAVLLCCERWTEGPGRERSGNI